jgi:anti-sigma regulatory factor (Ser/Thr protein kinase)
MMRVLAIGLSPNDRNRLAEMISAPVHATTEAAASPRDPNHPSAVVFRDIDANQLEAVLKAGFDIHVEWTAPEPTAAILRGNHPPLAISMTTRAAFQSLTGGAIVHGLIARNVLPGNTAEAAASAVQEALSNAVIHGNLGIRLDPSDGDRDFIAFHEEIARRIAGLDGLARRVMIGASWTACEVSVSIADEGDGFHAASESPKLADALAGRGLLIMKTHASRVAYQDDGRVVVLTFDRAAR